MKCEIQKKSSERNLELDMIENRDSYRSIFVLVHLVLPGQQSQSRKPLVLHPVVEENGISTLMLVICVRPDLALTALVELPPLHSDAIMLDT